MTSNPLVSENEIAFTGGPVAWFHSRFVHRRRVDVIVNHLAELVIPSATVLDVGCGDAQIASQLMSLRQDVQVSGIDILVRDATSVPVTHFDGRTIEFENNTFDTVIAIDVLHHAAEQENLLSEMARVARSQIIIKDHLLQGLRAYETLAWMDHIGNDRHGVEVPCNYLTADQWSDLYRRVGLSVTETRDALGLYLPPLNWFFERRLHFIASLEPLTGTNPKEASNR